jgi:hypothetical protein
MFDGTTNSKVVQFSLSAIEMVLHRSCLHRDQGLEFFLDSGRSHFFYFEKQRHRQSILQFLKKSLSREVFIQSGQLATAIHPFTEKWRQGLLSNYEYIVFVNLLAGRSFNDISQYPVFPWILSNYSTDTLDLNDERNYRDLRQPIGTLNEERLREMIVKYESLDDDNPNKCLYQTNYSNPFYVALYLVRLEPFTTIHVEINDGRFDKTSRQFWSIESLWKSVTSRATDYRELIPEFFTLPDFLVNHNEFDLGEWEGSQGGHVILPPWAKGSPHLFIDLHRQALESPFVSQYLPHWLDLMFGLKQTGDAAIQARNVFLPSWYPSCLNDPRWTDQHIKWLIEEQIMQFGAGPKQIWFTAHLPREVVRRPFPMSLQKFDVLFKLSFAPKYFYVHKTLVFVLGVDHSFNSIAFPKNLKAGFVPEVNQLDSLAKFFRSSDIGQCTHLGEPHRFISSSMVDDSFHVFKIDGSCIFHTSSVRQGSSLLATLTYAGPNTVLASWKDSSLTLWNLTEGRGCVQRYRQSPHLTSIVGVDTSPVLRLIASLDKNRRCILSFLRNGQFVRQFVVEGKSSEESFIKLMLFGGGYIAVLSSVKTPAGVTTVVRLYGLNTKKLGEFSFPEAVADCCKFETELAVSAIALVFSGGRFVLLGIPDGKVKLDIPTDKKLGLLQFVPQFGGFLATSAENEFCFITLD